MAIRPIYETPDPVLRQISKPVEVFDEELKTLISDMFETMYHAPGIGLAAVQVGVPIRLLVMDLQEPEEEDGSRFAIRRSSSTRKSSGRRKSPFPTPKGACQCPTNMRRCFGPTVSASAGATRRRDP